MPIISRYNINKKEIRQCVILIQRTSSSLSPFYFLEIVLSLFSIFFFKCLCLLFVYHLGKVLKKIKNKKRVQTLTCPIQGGSCQCQCLSQILFLLFKQEIGRLCQLGFCICWDPRVISACNRTLFDNNFLKDPTAK